MQEELFPRKIVIGEGFCNRKVEREKLAKLFSKGVHIWLQAHRRHGKTSLIEQVSLDMKKQGERIAQERCAYCLIVV